MLKSKSFLILVGIPKEMIDKPVFRLSGSQQQRVAIVRAIATNHDIIIADESTGNLDEETTSRHCQYLQRHRPSAK